MTFYERSNIQFPTMCNDISHVIVNVYILHRLCIFYNRYSNSLLYIVPVRYNNNIVIGKSGLGRGAALINRRGISIGILKESWI